jgi:AraC-like DNA-binding protein
MGGVDLKTWAQRMIWSYIPIFLIIFSFIFFVFFQELADQNKKNTIEASKVFTGQLMQSIDVSLKSVDHLIINEVLNNKLLIEYFDQENDKNVYLNYQIAKRVKALKEEAPMIDSMYLVRYKDQLVFTGNVIRMEDFGDYPFIQEIKKMSRPLVSHWTGFRPYRELSFQDNKNVVTLVREVPISLGTKGLFVVNINTMPLQRMMKEMNNSNIFVNLIDRNGKALFEDNASKNRQILSNVYSDYSGWTIESGLMNGMLINTVSIFSSVWVVLGVIIFILGIISIIYVTRKNYKPIIDIIARINTSPFYNSNSLGKIVTNEFMFIKSAIDNFIDQSKQFEKQFEEAALIRKKNFFFELISGTNKVDLDEEMTGLHYGIYAEKQASFIIEIDNHEALFHSYKQRDQYLFKFVLSSVCNEIMNNHSLSIWLEWTTNHQLTGIVFWLDSSEDITVVFEKFVAWVEANLKFTVTVGIGESGESLANISKSYNEAFASLKYKAVMGNNRVIKYDDTRIRPNKETIKHLHLIHNMVDSYRINEGGWEDQFFAIFTGIISDFLSKDDITVLINYFIYYLDLQISHISKDYHQIWENHFLGDLHRSAAKFETLDELQRDLLRPLSGFYDRIAAIREGRNYCRLLVEVRKYIEQHYSNPDLSLDYLSDRFQINAKYLSQLFKEEFGENFIDFLTVLRVNQAKRLLMNKHEPIQEIGEKVGYLNAVTFRRVFRRLEGISPLDFKKQNKLNEG